MTPFAALDQRLSGAAKQLILSELSGTTSAPSVPRELVQEQDAVDALLLAFAAIQEQVQASRMAPEAGARLAALLMLVRDFVRPLPPGIAPDGNDLLTVDLAEMLKAVRLSLRRA
jgi:hypothetical protein